MKIISSSALFYIFVASESGYFLTKSVNSLHLSKRSLNKQSFPMKTHPVFFRKWHRHSSITAVLWRRSGIFGASLSKPITDLLKNWSQSWWCLLQAALREMLVFTGSFQPSFRLTIWVALNRQMHDEATLQWPSSTTPEDRHFSDKTCRFYRCHDANKIRSDWTRPACLALCRSSGLVFLAFLLLAGQAELAGWRLVNLVLSLSAARSTACARYAIFSLVDHTDEFLFCLQ